MKFLEEKSVPHTRLSENELPGRVAELIAAGKVIGWFQWRMEFGPRALGARSIIGDARSPKMQEIMNVKIKFRESFRPFAPSVLKEKMPDYFDIRHESPYMLLVAPVKQNIRRQMTEAEQLLFGIDKLNVSRSSIPAVTHVDYSARIQSVDKDTNPLYHQLIEKFEEKSGCAVIINTSFNVRGEPLVCAPDEAYTCFMRTNMDYLVLGHFLLDKNAQKKMQKDIDWQKRFELD